jgi:DNA (cytosine-5)-methyltransferase 1
MKAFYNDNEKSAAEWLRELIGARLIAPGVVDERSITEIEPEDLHGYDRCHLFAGIGGWDYALQLAGWPASLPVWTASCPCQPFSSAGKGLAEADPRHLWPQCRRLISKRRPSAVFGEQVIGKSNLGLHWLDRVRADLEALGYAVGASDLCAAGVGAPHERQRIFWVADASGERGIQPPQAGSGQAPGRWPANDCPNADLSDAQFNRRQQVSQDLLGQELQPALHGQDGQLLHAQGQRFKVGQDAPLPRRQARSGPLGASPWDDYAVAWFDDPNKGRVARRIGSGISALAHGVPGRVGLLRGYGNAIVPALAALFVMSFMQAVGITPVWEVAA